ncbi:hypothetical protein ACIBCM_30160 [Streptomyces sp. NPDC051018]|uniref:hypothetical protein n=1 Tax=Streptomyces sp. NPDC051018 TaxID=3365639 RepID=UPI0037A0686D
MIIEHGYYGRGPICHETGHAVGLLHGNTACPRLSDTHPALGCMQMPPPWSASLGANNKENINRVY